MAPSRRPFLRCIALPLLLLTMLATGVLGDTLTGVPGTVALYHFDEGGGTTAADCSGHNHTGTLQGSTTWEAGLFGSALHFGGSDAYLQVDPIPLATDWTIQAWCRFPLESTTSVHTLIQNQAGDHHILTMNGDLGV